MHATRQAAPSTQGQRQHRGKPHGHSTSGSTTRKAPGTLARKPHVREHVRAVIGSIWNSGSLKSVYEPKSHHQHQHPKKPRIPFLQILQTSPAPAPAFLRAHAGNARRKSPASLVFTPPLGGKKRRVFGGCFRRVLEAQVFLTEPTEKPFLQFLADSSDVKKPGARPGLWWGGGQVVGWWSGGGVHHAAIGHKPGGLQCTNHI